DGLEVRPYSSREFLWEMGKIASKDPNSLVGACYRKGMPYFVPALNDSSIGIALAKHHHDRVKANKTPIAIDSIKDNYEIAQVKRQSPSTGGFYVGGGTHVRPGVNRRALGGHTAARFPLAPVRSRLGRSHKRPPPVAGSPGWPRRPTSRGG